MENFGVRLWRGGYAVKKIVPQASACCAKSPNFSDFPGVDPAQQQVRLNVTGVLMFYFKFHGARTAFGKDIEVKMTSNGHRTTFV